MESDRWPRSFCSNALRLRHNMEDPRPCHISSDYVFGFLWRNIITHLPLFLRNWKQRIKFELGIIGKSRHMTFPIAMAFSAETGSWNVASGFLQCHFPQKGKRQMIQVGVSWFVSFNFSYLGYFPSQQFQIDFSVFAATAPVFNDGCVSVSWEGRRKWSFIWIWHPELPNSCPTKSVLIWRRGQKLTLHVCLFGADVAAGVGS